MLENMQGIVSTIQQVIKNDWKSHSNTRCWFCSILLADQRLAESMRPYLDELQNVWPWLVLAGLFGGFLTVSIGAVFLITKRRYKAWPHRMNWKNAFALPEKQPLIWSNESEANRNNYQTTMWPFENIWDNHLFVKVHLKYLNMYCM